MSYLLDTNVISEVRRGRDPNVAAWAQQVNDFELHLSVLTLGEIRKGIERLRSRDPDQARVFAAWLAELPSRFAERILPVDARVADQWGKLNAPAERPVIDSLIAATALVHGLTVATRNTADFAECGVRLVNPWQPGRLPAKRTTSLAPEQWDGSVDGHSFYFRERGGCWRIELDLADRGTSLRRTQTGPITPHLRHDLATPLQPGTRGHEHQPIRRRRTGWAGGFPWVFHALVLLPRAADLHPKAAGKACNMPTG